MSRNNILNAVRKNKPVEAAPLPIVPLFNFPEKPEEAMERFCVVSELTGSRVIRMNDSDNINAVVKKCFPNLEKLASPLISVEANTDLNTIKSPGELERVDVAVIKGQLGVAENGAIWVDEADCVHRALPFICQHLVLVLDPARIVPNMHVAYSQIRVQENGFGVFIAGPSKTVDIEQSLVIGAQAARSLTVLLTGQTLF